MKIAMGRFLVSATLLALLLGGQGRAQQLGPAPEAETIPAGEPQGNVLDMQPNATGPFVPENGPPQLGPDVSSPMPPAPMAALQRGDNCCPPNWYVREGVNFMMRGHGSHQKTVLISRAANISQANTPSFSNIAPDTTSPPPFRWRLNQVILAGDLLGFSSTGRPVTDTGDRISDEIRDYRPAPGFDITLGHYLGRDSSNRDHFVEFTYSGLNHWQETYALDSVVIPHFDDSFLYSDNEVASFLANPGSFFTDYRGNLFSQFRRRDFASEDDEILNDTFNYADCQTVTYKSRYDNFELSMRIQPRRQNKDRLMLQPNGRWVRRKHRGMGISYLIGFRGTSLDESLNYTSLKNEYTGDYGETPEVSQSGKYRGEYDLRMRNNMIGIQLGADLVCFEHRLWTWGVRGRCGPMINFADQRSYILAFEDEASTLRIDREADRTALAGYGQVGMTASYQLRPNLVLRAAYDVMWMGGLALAPEQTDFTSSRIGHISTDGSLFFQTASIDVELIW